MFNAPIVWPAAPQLDVHRRPLGAAQFLHRLFGGPALGAFVADFREGVAAAHAFLVGRRSFENSGREDVAFGCALDLNTEAVVAPFLALAHLRVRFRIEKAGMWIQRAEHAANRAIDEAVGLDRPDVVGLDRVECDGKGLVIWSLVVDRQGAAAEKSADERRHDNRKDHGRDSSVTSHQRSVTDNFLTGNDFWVRASGFP